MQYKSALIFISLYQQTLDTYVTAVMPTKFSLLHESSLLEYFAGGGILSIKIIGKAFSETCTQQLSHIANMRTHVFL